MFQIWFVKHKTFTQQSGGYWLTVQVDILKYLT